MARSRAYAACPPLEGNNGRVTHKCQKPRNVVPDKDDFGSKLWLSTRTNAARFILLHLGAPVVLRPPMCHSEEHNRTVRTGAGLIFSPVFDARTLRALHCIACLPASRAFHLHGWLFGISRSHRRGTDEIDGGLPNLMSQEQDVNSMRTMLQCIQT
ncbi:hypothetical protein VPH35_061047 [Triticum aestivum]